MVHFLALLLLVQQSSAVIYSVNETEYRRMPALFEMDDYRECMLESGTYCLAVYDLHSRRHSDLMRFIVEYSEHTNKHFNHTQIHRGTCATTTCRKYLNRTLNRIEEQSLILEECTNETIWGRYGIEASLSKLQYCKKYDDKVVLDTSDYAVAAVYGLIILLNTIGSCYDIIICGDDNKKGNEYLLAFSMKRNWSLLTSPGGSGSDPRIERLKLFNGLRAMTMVCVIFAHAALLMTFTYISNPLFIEKSYDDLSMQILFNGLLVTHTFFVMSAFLLSYNLQIRSEKQQITWWHIPRRVVLRWLRLTPPYALIIATIATWMRHIGDGPLWQMAVAGESDMCRQYWWANILYFNNYVYRDDFCFPQGWYLAADTQLFCFGLVLMVVIQSPRGRQVALVTLFLVSLVITASHTYFQNLNAIVIQSPEVFRSIFVKDDTYNFMYIPGHTNLSSYVLGLAGGLLTYHWQVKEIDLSKLKNIILYRWAFWMVLPIGIAIILTGGIFYKDGDTPSIFLRVFYATLYKPVFEILIMCFIIGCIFKVENVYRGIVEWRGFTWAGRVSYSAFLLHTIFQRSYAGYQINEIFVNEYGVAVLLIASAFCSFFFGALLWLAVESPVSKIIGALLSPRPNNKKILTYWMVMVIGWSWICSAHGIDTTYHFEDGMSPNR